MANAFLIVVLAVFAPQVEGVSSQRNEVLSTPSNASVPHLLASASGVLPRTVDMTQHVLTQSGNMLVLETPAKPTTNMVVTQNKATAQNKGPYHLPKRKRSIKEQIMEKSDSEDTKHRAKSHKLSVPPRTTATPTTTARPSALKTQTTAPKNQAMKPVAVAVSHPHMEIPKPVMSTEPDKDLTKKADTKKAKSPLSLASFYAEENMALSKQQNWHMAGHIIPKAPSSPSPMHALQQRKVASLLDRQAQTTAARWQATLAETQREVQQSRQDNSIAISDQFSGLENDDKVHEQEVKREDKAARADTAPEAAVFDPKYHSNQVPLSKAFSALEQQDHAIEKYMNKAGDDADLSKIRTVQDESMDKISSELKHADEHPEEGHLPPAAVGRAFLDAPMHEQWAALENADGQSIKDIKRDPNLRAFIQRGVTSRHH